MLLLKLFKDVRRIVREITTEVDHLHHKLENIMATLQSFKDLVTALNTETDRLAAKLQELLDKIQAGGMSDAEEAEAQADIQGVIDRLKTIGADPAEPIPPVEEEPANP